LTNDEEDVGLKCMKMIKMGMPIGAVIEKMNIYGISQFLQAVVLAPDNVRGEIYIRSDGKKVRRMKRGVASTNQTIDGEIYTRPDWKKVRRIRRADKPRFGLSTSSISSMSESPKLKHISKGEAAIPEAMMLMKEKRATETAPRFMAKDHNEDTSEKRKSGYALDFKKSS